MIVTMAKPKTIGELLKQVHMDKIIEHGPKYSQADLARWFDLSPVIFNKYYNDKRIPDMEALRKLANRVGPIVYQLSGKIPSELEISLSQVPVDKYDELKKLIDDFLSSLGDAD